MNDYFRIEHLMGMPISVELVPEANATPASVALDLVYARLRDIDERFSTYSETSEVTAVGRGLRSVSSCSHDVQAVLRSCDDLRHMTNGVFDIHKAAQLGPARLLQGESATAIEPSGYVKGWAIDQAGALLRMSGYRGFCINAGGDVLVGGRNEVGEEWTIGVQHPTDNEALMALLKVSDCAVATSGSYARGNHIVSDTDELLSATIVGPDIVLADVLATTVYALGVDGLAFVNDIAGFDAMVVTSDGRLLETSGMAQYLSA